MLPVRRGYLVPFRIPLSQPLPVGTARIEAREGLVLALEDAEGRLGLGECAPLPGWHSVDLAQAAIVLRAAVQAVCGAPLQAFDLVSVGRVLDERLGAGVPGPVRFALEGALWHLLAQRASVHPTRLAGGRPGPVPLCALVPHDIAADRVAERLLESGVHTLKFKLRPLALEKQLAHVRAVANHLGPTARVRLDANATLDSMHTAVLAEGLAQVAVDFLEDPTPDVTRWDRVVAGTGFDVAADTLLDAVLAAPNPPPVGVWVLKPTMGGLVRALEMARRGRARGRRIVVSTTWETGLGRTQLAWLQRAVCPGEPAGLSMSAAGTRDVLATPLHVARGALCGPSIDGELTLGPGLLDRATRVER